MKFRTIFEKIIIPVWFWKSSIFFSTYRKNKTHKNFFCTYHYSYIYTYIPIVYTILLSRDLKNQKVVIHQRNKKKTAQRAWTRGRFLSTAACWFSFIFSFSFLIFIFPSYVFLILLSFLFFFFVICFSFVFLGFSLPSR